MTATWLERWERCLWVSVVLTASVGLIYLGFVQPMQKTQAELIGAINQLHQRVSALEARTPATP